jgi:Glutamyl-tRNAGlu reductase, N-terminal domain
MANAPSSSLHLLSIDFGSAPSSLRAVLELGSDDVEHWIRRARMAGAPLAIVCGQESIDLYSSDAGRRAAFKPLLESLWALGRNLEGFDRIRTREAYGHAVVRHLLRQAAGLESTEHGRSYSGCIAEARAQAARFGTLSDALRELFELANTTAERSEAETELSAVSSTRASRQLEALSAERIMEEQILAFRTGETSDAPSASLPPPAASSRPPSRSSYAADEPSTGVRLRVAPFRSLFPLSARKSS